jgi:hypothetical protein
MKTITLQIIKLNYELVYIYIYIYIYYHTLFFTKKLIALRRKNIYFLKKMLIALSTHVCIVNLYSNHIKLKIIA